MARKTKLQLFLQRCHGIKDLEFTDEALIEHYVFNNGEVENSFRQVVKNHQDWMKEKEKELQAA